MAFSLYQEFAPLRGKLTDLCRQRTSHRDMCALVVRGLEESYDAGLETLCVGLAEFRVVFCAQVRWRASLAGLLLLGHGFGSVGWNVFRNLLPCSSR